MVDQPTPHGFLHGGLQPVNEILIAELDVVQDLFDRIAGSPLGKRWRQARMDLWYYFLHRGLDLLRPGGRLAFVVNSYWTASSGARRLIDRLKRANEEFGITLFVIEHNMRVIMNLAEHIYCLAHGELLAEGTPDQIQNDQRVIDAYLGAH